MARREEARKEAAFMRGDAGVDGRSTTEDDRDVAELEKDKAQNELVRGRTWLGREFLTWLLWKSDGGEPLLEHEGEKVVVSFLARIVLRGLHGEVTELAAKGTLSPYSMQVRRALLDGMMVHGARVQFVSAERSWECSLDAEFLDVKSAKLPELLTEADDDRLTERLDLAERLSALVDALVNLFLDLRSSKKWAAQTVPAMKAWMAGEGERAGNKVERARRVAG